MTTPAGRTRTSPAGRGLTLRLLMLLPLAALALRVLGFRRVYRFVRHRPTRAAMGAGSAGLRASAERIAAAVVRVNRHVLPFASRCLLESLVLLWVLRRAGIEAELLLGVRTILGPFEAHAWVEYDGIVLNDDDDVRGVYEAFDLATLTETAPHRSPRAQTT